MQESLDTVMHLASLGTPGDRLELVPYSTSWPDCFRREAARIQRACGEWIIDIEHIGSTAVPGLAAKPILDIMPVLCDIEHAEHCIDPMKSLGYMHFGEYGIPGRAFFVLRHGDRRVAHVHMFAQSSPNAQQHLAFRDRLRADQSLRDAYAALKRQLARQHGDDREAYCDGKSTFILHAIPT